MSDQPSASALLKTIPLNPPILGVWFNGLYTTLFFVTLWAIVYRNPRDRRSAIWIATVVAMYACASIYNGVVWGFNTVTLSDDGATPGLVTALSEQPAWYKGVGMTFFSINIFIADCLFIWRCWVVWEKRWIVVILPILGTIAGQVLNILTIIGQVQITLTLAPTEVPLRFANLGTPYFGISLATSLITTGMIAFRIFMIQREVRGVGMRPQGSYARVLEILVESAALYAINLLAFVILLARLDVRLEYPESIMPQIAGMAPTLIICRVALGHSRPDSEWSRRNRESAIDIEFASGAAEPAPPMTFHGSTSTSSTRRSETEKRKQALPTFVSSFNTSISHMSSQGSVSEKVEDV